MESKTGEIIDRRRLENGMELILYDCSRSMIEDRWIIEILCKALIPLDKSYWATVADEDLRYRQAIREMLGEKLVFSSSQKRTFVDAEEKETIGNYSLENRSVWVSASASTTILSPSMNFPSNMCNANWS